MSEQNKRSRVKINAFDVFVIFLVLCLIGTFVYRLYNKISIDSHQQGEKYVMYFECEGMNSLSAYVNGKDAVYVAATGELLGNIQNDENPSLPALSEVSDGETETETAENNDATAEAAVADGDAEKETEFVYGMAKYTGRITLGKDVYKASDGNYFALGETNLTVGGKLKVYTNTAEFDILITDISLISE